MDLVITRAGDADHLQVILERFNLLLREYLYTLVNLIGVSSANYNREIICQKSLGILGHLIFVFKFLLSLREVILPQVPQVTAMNNADCDNLMHHVCWIMTNLAYQDDDANFVHKLIVEHDFFTEVTKLFDSKREISFEFKLLNAIVDLQKDMAENLPDKEAMEN